jgi:hypothetical protein
MNIFYSFLVVGIVLIFAIVQYDKQSKKKVSVILRDNTNVPPLFMLRSADLKIKAIKAALHTHGEFGISREAKKEIANQLEQLMESYTNKQIALSVYYAKLGALLISVNELKSVTTVS